MSGVDSRTHYTSYHRQGDKYPRHVIVDWRRYVNRLRTRRVPELTFAAPNAFTNVVSLPLQLLFRGRTRGLLHILTRRNYFPARVPLSPRIVLKSENRDAEEIRRHF